MRQTEIQGCHPSSCGSLYFERQPSGRPKGIDGFLDFQSKLCFEKPRKPSRHWPQLFWSITGRKKTLRRNVQLLVSKGGIIVKDCFVRRFRLSKVTPHLVRVGSVLPVPPGVEKEVATVPETRLIRKNSSADCTCYDDAITREERYQMSIGLIHNTMDDATIASLRNEHVHTTPVCVLHKSTARISKALTITTKRHHRSKSPTVNRPMQIC